MRMAGRTGLTVRRGMRRNGGTPCGESGHSVVNRAQTRAKLPRRESGNRIQLTGLDAETSAETGKINIFQWFVSFAQFLGKLGYSLVVPASNREMPPLVNTVIHRLCGERTQEAGCLLCAMTFGFLAGRLG